MQPDTSTRTFFMSWNINLLHQGFVAGDSIDGIIGRDAFLSEMVESKEFKGKKLHDIYLMATIDILTSKYGPEDFKKLSISKFKEFVSVCDKGTIPKIC